MANEAKRAEPVLEVEHLSIEIDVPAGVLHAVSDVSFQVGRGETLCIVGESGCGKSLTAHAVMGLLPRRARMSAERLALDGRDLRSIGKKQLADLRGDRMAMIFQDPMTSLNPVYRIDEQLTEHFIRHGKGSRKEAEERALLLLEKVGIASPRDRLRQYPHELSGGLRQRIMIAMALMCEPALLIADEPTTALDVSVQAQILRLLRDLQREFHTAMMLITHDLGVVAHVGDRVMVMYAGTVVETGTAAELFNNPLHPYTQGLLNCIPVPGKVAPGSRLETIRGTVPPLIGDLTGCPFRNRCPHRAPPCETDIPFRTVSKGRGFRCVLPVAQSAA